VIVVDTSVWVSALRSPSSPETVFLVQLLDADEVGLAIPVRAELLSGASVADRARLRRTLSALPVLYPTDETWTLIDSWIDIAARKGQRFALGDLLIGAMAAEQGALVWSLDADFARMAAVGLVGRYET
jgi:predicted nucleic acid-binding protein